MVREFREICYHEVSSIRRSLLGKMGEVYVLEIDEVAFSQKAKQGMGSYKIPINYLTLIEWRSG